MPNAAESGRLHFKRRPPPERLAGDDEAGDNAHLDRRFILQHRADLLHPAADEGQPVQTKDHAARRQPRKETGTGEEMVMISRDSR